MLGDVSIYSRFVFASVLRAEMSDLGERKGGEVWLSDGSAPMVIGSTRWRANYGF